MLKQIFFVYRDEFGAKLVEKLTQRASIQCYGLSKVDENFAYLIDDLRPELVMVDEQAYAKNSELIDESLSQANTDFKTVLLTESEEKGKFDFLLKLPISIDTFVDETRSLVERVEKNS